MKRDELVKNPVYWTTALQMELYRQIDVFMQKRGMNKTQLAEYLGCSKGYVTQLLSGDYDHKISKFVELSLAIGKIPEFTFIDVDEYIECENSSYVSTVSSNGYASAVCSNREIDDYIIAA
ncbi:helix-turn-helix domain-containing protein [Parabacteroides johnsonii]|uniref:helix-turn-helix domain-containing protein n=1 Tax=Parabacteroides johnsonii TaxID=387661 RepID=UPI001899C3FA|nr:helix-turn-helix transcriptional regulator [Parabacteroides johnsonii]